VLDPPPYGLWTNNLLGAHQRRVDDPNSGGSTSKVPMMTVPNAAKILRHDYYDWFERVECGVYALSPAGRRGLESFTPPDGRSRLRRC
jgi:hypothetical protein